MHTYTRAQTPHSRVSNQHLITDVLADMKVLATFVQLCLTSCILPFIHSLDGHLLNAAYEPGTIINSGDVITNETEKAPALIVLTFQ